MELQKLNFNNVIETNREVTKLPKIKKFRINAKKFYLTYSKYETTKIELLNNLNKLHIEFNKYLIAEELHKDGSKHFHCLLICNKKYNIINHKYFDIEGTHGNYQGVRKLKDVVNYCIKDKNFITNLSIDSDGSIITESIHLARMVESTGDVDKALWEYCQLNPGIENFPKVENRLTKYNQMLIRRNQALTKKKVYDIDTFDINNPAVAKVKEWVKSKGYKTTTLALIGDPGCGKTELTKTALTMAGSENIDLIRDVNAIKYCPKNTDGIIMDDVD